MKKEFRTLMSMFPEHAKLYLVGGCVRDSWVSLSDLDGPDDMFENVNDFDVEFHNMSLNEFEHYLEESGEEYSKVGKSFGVYKMKMNGLDFDLSLPRTDSKTKAGHCGFDVKLNPFMGLENAMKRRDFTINAVAMELFWDEDENGPCVNGRWHDPFGGLKDLKNRVLRMVDPETFGDDPLRVLRGVQFAGRFGLTVEPETFNKMKELVL